MTLNTLENSITTQQLYKPRRYMTALGSSNASTAAAAAPAQQRPGPSARRHTVPVVLGFFPRTTPPCRVPPLLGGKSSLTAQQPSSPPRRAQPPRSRKRGAAEACARGSVQRLQAVTGVDGEGAALRPSPSLRTEKSPGARHSTAALTRLPLLLRPPVSAAILLYGHDLFS